jgi:hypothetical protein
MIAVAVMALIIALLLTGSFTTTNPARILKQVPVVLGY